jgi:hypothetical protein
MRNERRWARPAVAAVSVFGIVGGQLVSAAFHLSPHARRFLNPQSLKGRQPRPRRAFMACQRRFGLSGTRQHVVQRGINRLPSFLDDDTDSARSLQLLPTSRSSTDCWAPIGCPAIEAGPEYPLLDLDEVPAGIWHQHRSRFGPSAQGCGRGCRDCGAQSLTPHKVDHDETRIRAANRMCSASAPLTPVRIHRKTQKVATDTTRPKVRECRSRLGTGRCWKQKTGWDSCPKHRSRIP